MFTRQQAETALDEVLRLRSELDEAECKSGVGEAIEHALCAAANRRDRNGGIVFVGIDKNFAVCGVSDVEDTQTRVVDWASQTFNVPLRVAPEILEREDKAVVAVIVPPCPAGHRPCHVRKHGPYEGSHIRVGNSSRFMTRDEVRREIALDETARGIVPPFDASPYLQASMGVLDNELIEKYIEKVKKARPSSRIGSSTQEQILQSIGAIAEHDGQWYPTPAGLLFFCREPQRYLPQSSVEFLHLWGPELTSLGPDGSRWRLNKEVFGTLPQIIDEVEALIYERIANHGFIDNFRRRDEPEYPRFALREAIVNAVAHRDYTLRGSRIQVKLYPDRLEVHTPGGLPPPVTVDNIEDEQATRNEAVVIPLIDFGYMERRGYGFDGVVSEMRKAGLSPPLVLDNGSSFNLCLKSHFLMSPETLNWLRRFDKFDLSQQERLALAYLRSNEGFITRLYNRDYVRLTGCTSVEATQALRRMVEKGVLLMQNTRAAAFYTLPANLPDAEPNLLNTAFTDEERIIEFARREGRITAGLCISQLNIPRRRTSALLRKLSKPNQPLEKHSEGRWRYYTPAP